jgi:lipoic acid synthetase
LIILSILYIHVKIFQMNHGGYVLICLNKRSPPVEALMLEHQETGLHFGKPQWLRRKLPTGPQYEQVISLLRDGDIHTVCQEAKCPNQWECFSCKTATFLIMGPRCTRNCRFCAVDYGPIGPPDPGEPARVADAAFKLGLSYVVVTSVTRDDLDDGGAVFFAETIRHVRDRLPDAKIEVLIPDFQGNKDALKKVVEARPNVLNHNIETVPSLYPSVRPGADYRCSLELLRQVKEYDPSLITKSGLMLGFGETSAELLKTLQDLVDTGCSMLTLGQYLQPSSRHLAVERFVPPEEFDKWRETALKTGFTQVASGPFVRSSYHAGNLYLNAETDKSMVER